MSESLLTVKEVAGRLRISRKTFYEHQPELIAKGLQRIRQGRLPKYTESSFEKLIRNAAKKDIPLW